MPSRPTRPANQYTTTRGSQPRPARHVTGAPVVHAAWDTVDGTVLDLRDRVGTATVLCDQDWQNAVYTQDARTRISAARRTDCPPRLLHELAGSVHPDDPYNEARIAAVTNPNCPASTLRAVIRSDPDPVVVAAAVAHPDAAESDIRHRLRQGFNPGIASTVAKLHVSTVTHLANIDMFPDDETAALPAAAYLQNPECSPTVLRHLYYEHPPVRSRRSLASLMSGHPNCPPNILTELAASDDPVTASNVAQHPNTPADTLRAMTTRSEATTRATLARNPNCPPDVIDVLSRDSSPTVVLAVLERSDCPPQIIERLVFHADRIVSRRAVTHPNCGPHAQAAYGFRTVAS